MTTKNIHLTWGIIALILVAAIIYLAWAPKTTEEISDPTPTPLVQGNQTVPAEEPAKEIEWSTYQSADGSFAISFPSDGKTDTPGGPKPGTRIENLDPNRPDNYQLKSGDYYIEVYMENGQNYCKPDMFSEWRKVTVSNYSGYRGTANDGPYSGYRYMICVDRGSDHFLVTVTTGDEDQALANRVLDSFIITADIKPAVQLKTYTNTRYGYSFQYPSQYLLNSESLRGQYLKDKAWVTVHEPSADQPGLAFSQFMLERARASCDADGPSGSTQCLGYAEPPTPFKTAGGLDAYTLILIEQHTTMKNGQVDSVTNRDRTFYAVNLGGKKSDSILLIVDPINDLNLSKDIALSVKKK